MAHRIKKVFWMTAILLYGVSLCSLAIPFGARNGIFVSPDEHAVWTFAERVAFTGIAQVSEARNVALGGLLFPRSAVATGSAIVPAGFLGMPYLAGALYVLSPIFAALAGPLFGMLGLVVLFFIIKKMGGTQEFALMSVVVLALHPAWWYYSIRSLMPNVPFTSFLLCAIFLAITGKEIARPARRFGAYAVSGALVALAVFVRVSEWIWIAGLLCAVAYIAPVRTYKKEILSAFGGFALVAIVALLLQNLVYGNPLTTGYTVHIPAWEVGGALSGDGVSWFEKIFALLFPFGIHEKATLRNAWNYLVVVYPWMTALAGIGGIFLVKRFREMLAFAKDHNQRWMRVAAVIFATLSVAYLVILYGSWTFYDNPDPNVISLGNSHVRYWLPLVVVCAPLSAYGLLSVKEKLSSWAASDRSRALARAFPAAVLVLVGILSGHAVFFADDGVMDTRAALQTFEEKREKVLAETPTDAIIIVDRADKYLWPDRAVVVPLRSERTYANLPALLDAAPLYYFGITLPEEDLAFLQSVTLKDTGIIFTPIFTINEETLYVIHR